MRAGFVTDCGKKRKVNQDRYLSLPELQLFALADGMGGHNGGETASLLALQALETSVRDAEAALSSPFGRDQVLRDAFAHANTAIYRTAQEHPPLKGMGTTLTAVWAPDLAQVFIGQVGDSRCYLQRGQEFFQITLDHSQVAERVRARVYSKEQARTQKGRNILTRAVGYEATTQADIWRIRLLSGDRLILCSDGLHGEVPEAVWWSTLRHQPLGPEAAAQALMEQALAAGGNDNVTVGVLDF